MIRKASLPTDREVSNCLAHERESGVLLLLHDQAELIHNFAGWTSHDIDASLIRIVTDMTSYC